MTKEVRLRTGSSNDHINFTGAASEITVDSDKKIVVVHDGNKQGGYELVGVGVTQTLTNKTIIVGASTITGTASQPLQVTGGAYISDNLGIGTTNPTSKLDVVGSGNFTGIVTATTFSGNLNGGSVSVTNLYAPTGIVTNISGSSLNYSGLSTVSSLTGTSANYTNLSATNLYAPTGIVTNISGTNLNYIGIATFTNGPVLIGSGTSQGTANQTLQVTGGAYVSGSLGIGTTNPQSQLQITGQFQSTKANSTADGGGQIYLNGATGNRIDFNGNGTGIPTTTTRSAGTKIVLSPTLTSFYTDCAIGVDGIDNSNVWFSTPYYVNTFKWYAGTNNIATLNGTGTFTANNFTAVGNGAPQIYLNSSGVAGNRIDFNTNGVAAPTFTNRSVGTKIVYYPQVDSVNVDYATGIESNALWSSIPNSLAQFKWYAGTTNIANLTGDGNLGIGTTNPTSKLDVRGDITFGLAGVNTISSSSDIRTWQYINKSKAAGDTAPQAVYIGAAGTQMFVLGNNSDVVIQYPFTTPYDISTAGTATTSFSVAAQETVPTGIDFNSDGTKMFISGQTGVAPLTASSEYVHEYSLSTPWNVAPSSVGYTTSFNVTQDTAPQGVIFGNSGSKMFVLGNTTDTIYQYSLSTPYSLASGVTYDNISLVLGTNPFLLETTPIDISFNSTGTVLWIAGSTNDRIYEFRLGTAWDISTAVFYDDVYIGFNEIAVTGLHVIPEQNVAYIVGTNSDIVFQYSTNTHSVVISSSGISTNSSIVLNNETRIKDKLYVKEFAHFDSSIVTQGNIQLDGDLTVSGGTITAGNVATSLLAGNTTTNVTLIPTQTSGTFILGGTSGTGTITLGRSTTSQTINIATGVSIASTVKTVNIGTGGGSGSRTLITMGSATSGAASTVYIPSPTNLGIGSATPTSSLTVTGDTLMTGVTTITGNLNAPGNYYVKLARTTNQTIPNNTDTLLGFTATSDTNGWYSGITTRTTPTVAGTYRVDAMVNWQAGTITNNQTNIQIRKNGSTFALHQVGITTFSYSQTACGIVTMNGTSDYIDFTVFTGNTTNQVVNGPSDGAWTKMEIFKIN